MAWSKYMEDNQDYFEQNMSRRRGSAVHGVAINGVLYSGENETKKRFSPVDGKRPRPMTYLKPERRKT